MDRSFVKTEFKALRSELEEVRDNLSGQIRKQTKTIIWTERRLKRLKKSVIALKEGKKKVVENLNRLSRIRNGLQFITSEPHQIEEPVSSEGIDTDVVSEETPSEADDGVFKVLIYY